MNLGCWGANIYYLSKFFISSTRTARDIGRHGWLQTPQKNPCVTTYNDKRWHTGSQTLENKRRAPCGHIEQITPSYMHFGRRWPFSIGLQGHFDKEQQTKHNLALSQQAHRLGCAYRCAPIRIKPCTHLGSAPMLFTPRSNNIYCNEMRDTHFHNVIPFIKIYIYAYTQALIRHKVHCKRLMACWKELAKRTSPLPLLPFPLWTLSTLQVPK
ncbi:hypothetical protein TRVL_01473 [Trypanosoma vivax]|nr:hypothetical protein TRVL_01473 [Trypanosoma vivax]